MRKTRWFLLALTTAATAVSVAVQQPPLDRNQLRAPVRSVRMTIVKPMGRPSAAYPTPRDYMRILERFPAYVARGWRTTTISGVRVGFFGDPDHAEMGLRSLGNTVFLLALLATEASYDPRPSGYDQLWCRDRARECLNYMLRSHVTGDITCADGKPWGNHWQSSWWTAKMGIGAMVLWPHLTVSERRAVERVVAHEADRHLPRKAPGGAVSNTRSEENAWDTEALAVAIALMPTHEHAPAWRSKLVEFAINTLSAPQDRSDQTLLDGRPIADQVYTANIHSDFTTENHGAYHTCYMACPLHSLTWGYYALSASGQSVPQAQFHHFADVWNRMKPTFLLRRFAYPAGKDWPRYAYGMSFIMPALVALQYRFRDAAARAMERQRVLALETEQVANGDGTFYGKRFTRNIIIDRMAEYETDTYANLGLCYLMHLRHGPPRPAMSLPRLQRSLASSHISREAGVAWTRSPRVFASMAWRRLEGQFPSAFFIPVDAEDTAEWGINNLLGRVAVDGVDSTQTRTSTRDRLDGNVLDSRGYISYRSASGAPLFTHYVVFRADPDAGMALVSYRFIADDEVRVTSREGLRLHIANDFFNGYRRVWYHDGKPFVQRYEPKEPPPEQETLREVRFRGNAVNVDGRLGIADLDGSDRFALRVSDRANGPWGSVHYAVLDCPPMATDARAFERGETILAGRFLIVHGDLQRTRRLARHLPDDLTTDPLGRE